MRYARHGFLLSTEGATEPGLPDQGSCPHPYELSTALETARRTGNMVP